MVKESIPIVEEPTREEISEAAKNKSRGQLREQAREHMQDLMRGRIMLTPEELRARAEREKCNEERKGRKGVR
jgi:hypothetical protein